MFVSQGKRSGALREFFRHERCGRRRTSQAFGAATVVDRQLVGLDRIPTGLVVRAVVSANVDLAFGAERPFDPQDGSRRTHVVDEIKHPVFLEFDRIAWAFIGDPQTHECLAVFFRRRRAASQYAAGQQHCQ